MKTFGFDVETLGVESNAVVLSCGIVKFDITQKPTYRELIENSLFIKFDATEQIKKLKRTVMPSTIDWWKKQAEIVQELNVRPKPTDLSAVDGLALLRDYAGLNPDSNDNRNVIFWTRGSLDQVCIDSLARSVGQDILIPYNNYRDVRTMLDCTKDTVRNGYCDVKLPGFDQFVDVYKHNPCHDAALDIMMMIYGD